MKKIILGIIIIFLFVNCNGQEANKKANEKYVTYRSEFNSILTSHFPDKLTSFPNTYVNNKNLLKNDVCFMLYEYNHDFLKSDSILNLSNYRFIAKYNSKDLCLLIVNRFETKETYYERKKVKVLDSLLINKDCYKKRYPIPNFIEYDKSEGSNTRLDESFNIYVIDAKSGNYFKEFDLQPDPQMPKEWQNGYSKGIAVSKEKKIVIYWAIIW